MKSNHPTRAIVTSLLARGLAVGATILQVPIASTYLGTELYGVFVGFSVLLSWMALGDLGVGNAIISDIAIANSDREYSAISRAISNAILQTSTVAIAVTVTALVLLSTVDLRNVYPNLSDGAVGFLEAFSVSIVLAGGLSIVGSIGGKIQLGLQKVPRTNLWQIVASCATLLGAVVIAHLDAGPAIFAIWIVTAPSIVSILSLSLEILYLPKEGRPTWRHVEVIAIYRMAKSGLAFLLIQIAQLASSQSDTLIVGVVDGAISASTFGVTHRLFALVPMVTGLVLAPYWPLFATTLAKGDRRETVSLLLQTGAMSVSLAAVATIGLAMTNQRLVSLLAREVPQAPGELVFGIAASTFLICSTHFLGLFLFAANRLRFSLLTSLVMLPIGYLIKVWLFRAYGSVGIPWGTFLSYLLCTTFPVIIYSYFLFRGNAQAYVGTIRTGAKLSHEK